MIRRFLRWLAGPCENCSVLRSEVQSLTRDAIGARAAASGQVLGMRETIDSQNEDIRFLRRQVRGLQKAIGAPLLQDPLPAPPIGEPREFRMSPADAINARNGHVNRNDLEAEHRRRQLARHGTGASSAGHDSGDP